MKQIELNERGEDVTDYNRGYREGYDATRVSRTKYQLVRITYKFKCLTMSNKNKTEQNDRKRTEGIRMYNHHCINYDGGKSDIKLPFRDSCRVVDIALYWRYYRVRNRLHYTLALQIMKNIF